MHVGAPQARFFALHSNNDDRAVQVALYAGLNWRSAMAISAEWAQVWRGFMLPILTYFATSLHRGFAMPMLISTTPLL